MSHLRRLTLAAVLLALSGAPFLSVQATSFGNHGSFVAAGADDFAQTLVAFSSPQAVLWAKVGTDYYLHIGSGTLATVGDVKLSDGSRLTSSNLPTYEATPAAANFRWLEKDGKPGFTGADWVYIDTNGDGKLSTGDLRVAVQAAQALAVPLQTGELDYQDAASTTERNLPDNITFDGALEPRIVDLNQNGVYDNNEGVVLVNASMATFETSFLHVHQVVIAKWGAFAHGTRIVNGAADTMPIYVELTSSDVRVAAVGGPACTEQDIYLHFGDPVAGGADYIQPGDIVLRKSGIAGWSVVSTSTAEVGQPISSAIDVTPMHYRLGNETGTVAGDTVYLDLNGLGSCTGAGLSVGDLRVTPYTLTGGSQYASWSTVGAGEQDVIAFGPLTKNPGGAATAWYFASYDHELNEGRPLQGLAKAKRNGTSNAPWDPATQAVYIDNDDSNNVTVNDTRIYNATGASGTHWSSTTLLDLVEAGDWDVGNNLTADGNFRVTGANATFEANKDELVVYSPDAILTPGHDILLTNATTQGQRVSEAQGRFGGQRTSNAVAYAFTFAPTGESSFLGLLRPGDVKLGASPARVAATGTDVAAVLTQVSTANQTVLKVQLDGSAPSQSAYYLALRGGATSVAAGDLRLTPYAGRAAGARLTGSDSGEVGQAANAVDAAFEQHVGHKEVDTVSGITPGDGLYLNLATALGGTSGTNLDLYDIRLSAFAGSSTLKAGTMVLPLDADAKSPITGPYTNHGAFKLAFFDEDRDGVVDAGEQLYVHNGALPTVPSLHTVRLAGAGGATSIVGTTGSPAPAPAAAPPTTSSAPPVTTSSSPVTTTPSTTTTTGQPIDTSVLATINQALAASLQVEEAAAGGNNLYWTAQSGVAGYQVFAADSPFVHVFDVPATQTAVYHAQGKAGTTYLVTAFLDAATLLDADDVNGGAVPGHSGVPAGEGRPPPRGFIPAPGVAFALAALAAAVVVARRRLS